MAIRPLRRLLQALFVILAMTNIVFIGVHASGEAADIVIAPRADQAERARVIATLDLDRPLWKRYILFLRDARHGDPGRSDSINVLDRLVILAYLMMIVLVFVVINLVVDVVCCLLDPRVRSASGKSTLGRTAPGILPLSEGHVLHASQDIATVPPADAKQARHRRFTAIAGDLPGKLASPPRLPLSSALPACDDPPRHQGTRLA